MYLGFFASNAVLGGQALAKVTGLPTNWSITIIGLISVVATIIAVIIRTIISVRATSKLRKRLIRLAVTRDSE